MTKPPGLGPHLVGQRVVVRRVVPGETGPTGGPAFTDVLGVMESWEGGVTTVRRQTGELAVIRVADIVSGKPVPPRPSVRHRVSAEEAERRAAAGWPALETQRLGDWLLRASQGFSGRANSVLAAGDPGVPMGVAFDTVVAFYEHRGLPPWAQVVVGSDAQRAFDAAGWTAARPGEADTEFQLASVARALRSARERLPEGAPEVALAPTTDPGWLADEEHALAHGAAALGVLEGPDEVAFASVRGEGADGSVLAKARAAYADDWLGISNVWVSPDHRRRGLAVTVLAEVLAWGAELGATTAYLQTRGDNPAALHLYERLGFVTHHTYRYLTVRGGGS